MNSSVTRRSILARLGWAAACGTVASGLLPVSRAAESSEAALCLSMFYRNAAQAKFDADRYAGQYLPMLKSVGGDSVERIELRTPRPMAMPDATGSARRRHSGSNTPQPAAETLAMPPPPLLAAVSVWLRDIRAFGERTSAAGQLAEELGRITDAEPIMQFDNVVALLGESRDSVPLEGNVVSTYFPGAQGARFDAKYYGEKVITQMIRLYGADSIRRVEFNTGVAQGGQMPAVIATAHFYVRDRVAWDAAAMRAYPQLMAEGPKYTDIRPFVADMQVAAAA